jgi:MerR family transcriptional regulator, heat shock protein HspR
MKRKKGYFSISAVAKMFSVHQQTIRLYEKEGLIVPKRSEGNTRLFSEEDVDKLEEIIYLTHQLGINLAGVDMILKLQKKIKRLQNEMNKVFDDAHDDLTREGIIGKEAAQESAKKLITIKHENLREIALQNKQSAKDPEESLNLVQWEVDYDE